MRDRGRMVWMVVGGFSVRGGGGTACAGKSCKNKTQRRRGCNSDRREREGEGERERGTRYANPRKIVDEKSSHH